MSGFVTLLKNDLRIITKDYKTLLLLFILPLLSIFVFSSAMTPLLEHNGFIEPFNIVLVDNDGSAWTGLLATQLRNLEVVDNVIYADEKDARNLIKNSQAAAAIIIPENLSESIDYWDPQAGKVLGSNLAYLPSQLVKNIGFVGSDTVSSGLASLNVIFNTEVAHGYTQVELYQEIGHAFESFVNVIMGRKTLFTIEKIKNRDTEPILYYAMSLMSVFIMFASIPSMKLLTDERKLGILSRLNTAPIKSWQNAVSKLAVSFVISTAQFGSILLVITLYRKTYSFLNISSMIPVFMATSLAAGAFSIMVAALSTSPGSADLFINLSILLMAIVGGSLYPLSSLPVLCRYFSIFTINRWSAQGFLNALYGGDFGITLQSICALLVLTFLFLLTASFVLRIRRRRVEG